MPSLLLCSMTVPWPSRPTQGLYHLDQAAALKGSGIKTSILSPAPACTSLLSKHSQWAARHADRPEHYQARGVDIHTPRVPFVFPNMVRQRLAPAVPSVVGRYSSFGLERALKRSIQDQGSDAVLAHGMLPWGEAISRVGSSMDIPVGVIEHSAGDVMRLRRKTRLGRYYMRCARRVKRIFVVNRRMKRHLEEELGLDNVVLALNGVELNGSDNAVTPRPSRFMDKTLILSAANYYRRKGFEELIRASAPLLRSRSNLALVIFTDAPESLCQLPAGLGIEDQVEIRPKCNRQTLLQWMAWADLFAMPSWSESFGLVYAEAMASGTPVLMTSDAGMSDELPSGRSPGWVVPPRDPWALEHALTDAVSNPERLYSLGQMAAHWIYGRFSWQRNAEVIATHLLERHANQVDLNAEAPMNEPA